jgi:hypothetical protein
MLQEYLVLLLHHSHALLGSLDCIRSIDHSMALHRIASHRIALHRIASHHIADQLVAASQAERRPRYGYTGVRVYRCTGIQV